MDNYADKCQDKICDIVLTFDDGPNPKTTPKLLDFFEKNDIRAFFFVLGQKLVSGDGLSIVKRAHKEGHVIGNHSFNHPNLTRLTKSQIRDEIWRTHELICNCTDSCNFFRPPYGSSNRIVEQVIKELGYKQIFWNVDTMDWKYKNDSYWMDYGIKKLKTTEKNIILMHDNYHTTVNNIPYFIARIKLIPNINFSLIYP